VEEPETDGESDGTVGDSPEAEDSKSSSGATDSETDDAGADVNSEKADAQNEVDGESESEVVAKPETENSSEEESDATKDTIGIIGGADGPTAIFVAGSIGDLLLWVIGAVAVVAVVVVVVLTILVVKRKK